MDGVQEITQVISSVGFPIVACGALFWMINTTMVQLKDTINTSMMELTNAITELAKSMDKANTMNEGVHFG